LIVAGAKKVILKGPKQLKLLLFFERIVVLRINRALMSEFLRTKSILKFDYLLLLTHFAIHHGNVDENEVLPQKLLNFETKEH